MDLLTVESKKKSTLGMVVVTCDLCENIIKKNPKIKTQYE